MFAVVIHPEECCQPTVAERRRRTDRLVSQPAASAALPTQVCGRSQQEGFQSAVHAHRGVAGETQPAAPGQRHQHGVDCPVPASAGASHPRQDGETVLDHNVMSVRSCQHCDR